MPGLDRDQLFEIFSRLGDHLRRPATICLIGSVPGIIGGQPERSTEDIDVWAPTSDFDTGDLLQACAAVGVLFDPRGEIDPGTAYIQIVRPGITQMPVGFRVETIARFGSLTVTMPAPAALCASKLLRASDSDLEDIVWWLHQSLISTDDIAEAVATLPSSVGDIASENLVLLAVLAGGRDRI